MRLSRTNVIVLACALCLAVIVSGCTESPDSTATRPAQEPTGGVTDTSDIEYGITETSDSISATGILMHIDDGAGLFWAIADESEPSSSRIPPLLAVISNPADIDADTHSGQVVRVTGVQDPFKAEDRGVPRLKANRLETLDDQHPAEVGVTTLEDGRVRAVGEVTFFDTGGPPEMRWQWALRVPPASSEQLNDMYVAFIQNPDDIGLPEFQGMVVITGSVLETTTAGVPVIQAEEISTTF